MNNSQTTYSGVFGSIVSSLRQQQGKEQLEIANHLGISQASYSRLESGKSSMSTDQIFVVSSALGVNASELFTQTENSIKALKSSGYKVIPQLRGSGNATAGTVVVGAALGALLVGILAKR